MPYKHFVHASTGRRVHVIISLWLPKADKIPIFPGNACTVYWVGKRGQGRIFDNDDHRCMTKYTKAWNDSSEQERLITVTLVFSLTQVSSGEKPCVDQQLQRPPKQLVPASEQSLTPLQASFSWAFNWGADVASRTGAGRGSVVSASVSRGGGGCVGCVGAKITTGFWSCCCCLTKLIAAIALILSARFCGIKKFPFDTGTTK